MNGQWIGFYTGTSDGMLMMNVDDRGSHFEGVGYLRPNDQKIPTTGVGFRTTNRDETFRFETSNLWAIHPITGNATGWEDIKSLYPDGFRKWPPLSRPFFGRNKLRIGGSDFEFRGGRSRPRHSGA